METFPLVYYGESDKDVLFGFMLLRFELLRVSDITFLLDLTITIHLRGVLRTYFFMIIFYNTFILCDCFQSLGKNQLNIIPLLTFEKQEKRQILDRSSSATYY